MGGVSFQPLPYKFKIAFQIPNEKSGTSQVRLAPYDLGGCSSRLWKIEDV